VTLDAAAVRRDLWREYRDIDIYIEQSAGSTNDIAKALAADGAAHGSLVIADEQTGGRGRFKRSFHSPGGRGLYMSVILRLSRRLPETAPVTIAAALAVCRSVKRLTGLSPMIKWVNDVFVDGKKVCGILTETSAEPSETYTSAVIVGVGINVDAGDGDFPEALRGSAGSLYPRGDAGISRNALAASVVNELLALCARLYPERNGAGPERGGAPPEPAEEADPIAVRARLDMMREYRSLSMVIGREVAYTYRGGSGTGLAAGVGDDGRLIVKNKADGAMIALDSGEVSIRTV